MRKLAVTIIATGLLFLSAAPAHAEESDGGMPDDWVLINYAENRTIQLYVHPASIRQDGNIVEIWIAQNYPELTTRFESSGIPTVGPSRVLHQVDCDQRRIKFLDFTFFTAPGFLGEQIKSPTTGKWQYIAPGTFNESIYMGVCD